MLIIRFIRIGKKNQPFFRIVVTDKKNPPRGGRFLEVLGFFNPLTKEKGLRKERIKYWLSVGAQTSDRVHNLLVAEKIIEGKKIAVHKKTKKKGEKKEKPKEEPKKEVKEEAKERPKEEVKKEEKPEKKKEEAEKKAEEKPKREAKEKNTAEGLDKKKSTGLTYLKKRVK